MSDRLIALSGVHNFRHFGGYVGAEGRVVRRDRLYRSAHLARATADDVARIAALKIAIVADLRRPMEREADPSPWSGATPRVFASPAEESETEALPPHLRFLVEADEITAEGVRGYMMSAYARIPYEPQHQTLFSEVIRGLAEEGGPLLVHCAAGKDRTGVLCGLILDALGVGEADVMADYELTNTAVNLERIAASAAERVAEKLGRTIAPADILPMAQVSRDYLDEAWRLMRERHGSLAGYRREALGLDADVEAALRARLLED